MSFQALAATIKITNVTTSQKLLLICIANYAGDQFTAFPSQTTLARDACMTRETVNRNLLALEKLGLISREVRSRENGSQTTSIITLLYCINPVILDHTPCDLKSHPLCVKITPPVILDHTHNLSINQSYNQSINLTPIVPINSQTIVGEIITPFDDFWKAYPRKVAKTFARKSYDKAIKSGANHQSIMEGLERSIAAWSDPKFIPHPATWLNHERWNDEPIDDLRTRENQGRPVSHWLSAIENIEQRTNAGID